MCRGVSGSPTLPWAACLVARAPRRTFMARRVPPAEPTKLPTRPEENLERPVACARLDDGTATAANSLLASDPPRLPVRAVRDPEGFAFTAVSPFY